MRQGQYVDATPIHRGAMPCGCGAPGARDPELQSLFHDLALTLYQMLDPGDADILMRAEMQGQTPADIAAQIGCSPEDAARRLARARRCFCQLAATSLLSAGAR